MMRGAGRRIDRWWDRLIEPVRPMGPDERRIARRMSAILYGLVPVYGVIVPLSACVRRQPMGWSEALLGIVPPMGAVGCVVLARRGRGVLGSWLLALLDVVSGMGVALEEDDPLRAVSTVFFVLTGVVYAAYLLSVRATVAMSAVALAALAVFGALHPALHATDLVLAGSAFVLISTVVAMGTELREEYVREIQARKREADDSAARMRAIMDASPDAIVTTDSTLRVVEWNRQAEGVLCRTREEALGSGLPDLVLAPDHRASLKDAFFRHAAGLERGPFEIQATDARGRSFPVEVSFSPAGSGPDSGWIFFLRNISERKQLQAERVLNDRLATVGRLAASVAHEINNPMTYVISNLEYLDAKAPEETPEVAASRDSPRHVLREALGGAYRVRDIVKDLRTFARRDGEALAAVDVRDVLEQAVRLSRVDRQAPTRLVREYDDVPRVHANDGRLSQVFVNLLVNASSALPKDARGEIRLRIRREPDGRVSVQIRDNGPGISPEDRERLFAPFFTTKTAGEGTGLGLFVSLSIMRALGGDLLVDSEPGRGAAFTVLLAAAQGAADKPVEQPSGPAPAGLRILVVDDDPGVTAALRRSLPGHEITEALGGTEALVLCRARTFDLVLTDLVMPGMSGAELAGRLAAEGLVPDERIVIMTAAAQQPEHESAIARRPDHVLEKPLDPRRVDAVLRRVAQTLPPARTG